jgi:hypothetical protein
MIATFELASLLEQAGFRLRGRRAECIHCQGRSRWTVSFTPEVAFCHRCKWTANVVTLARELGLLEGNPELRERLLREASERGRRKAEEEKFDAWRGERIREVSARRRSLWRNAGLAEQVLKKYRDCEPAWDALARWYHAEARLSATLDYLTFTKASPWLESDSIPEQVLEMWRQGVRAA